MKKYLIISSIFFSSIIAFAGNPAKNEEKKTSALIIGQVIDKTTGEEIAGAEIYINDKIIYSDLEGKFSATVDVNYTNAVIKYISYNDTKVKMNPSTYNTVTIELTSK